MFTEGNEEERKNLKTNKQKNKTKTEQTLVNTGGCEAMTERKVCVSTVSSILHSEHFFLFLFLFFSQNKAPLHKENMADKPLWENDEEAGWRRCVLSGDSARSLCLRCVCLFCVSKMCFCVFGERKQTCACCAWTVSRWTRLRFPLRPVSPGLAWPRPAPQLGSAPLLPPPCSNPLHTHTRPASLTLCSPASTRCC